MANGGVGIGILGAGAMGAAHAAAYADIREAEVVAVFARDLAHAQAVAELCGAVPCTDPRALIDNDAIDAIDVCLPSAIHGSFVVPALTHGKHVFCETPLALELADARRMRDAARGAGRLLQVGLLMRSVAPYEYLKAAAVSGEHGRLLSLATYRLGSYLRPDAPDHKPHYGDPSTELMTFDFDVANWLFGPPIRVSASAAALVPDQPGEISALLGYADGRHATIVASGLMPAGHPFSVGFRALFERALVELHNVFAEGPPRSKFTVTDDTGGSRDLVLAGRNPYQAELRRFIDCIRGRADPALLDADRAIEALLLSIATQRSLAAGRTIRLCPPALHPVRRSEYAKARTISQTETGQ